MWVTIQVVDPSIIQFALWVFTVRHPDVPWCSTSAQRYGGFTGPTIFHDFPCLHLWFSMIFKNCNNWFRDNQSWQHQLTTPWNRNTCKLCVCPTSVQKQTSWATNESSAVVIGWIAFSTKHFLECLMTNLCLQNKRQELGEQFVRLNLMINFFQPGTAETFQVNLGSIFWSK